MMQQTDQDVTHVLTSTGQTVALGECSSRDRKKLESNCAWNKLTVTAQAVFVFSLQYVCDMYLESRVIR